MKNSIMLMFLAMCFMSSCTEVYAMSIIQPIYSVTVMIGLMESFFYAGAFFLIIHTVIKFIKLKKIDTTEKDDKVEKEKFKYVFVIRNVLLSVLIIILSSLLFTTNGRWYYMSTFYLQIVLAMVFYFLLTQFKGGIAKKITILLLLSAIVVFEFYIEEEENKKILETEEFVLMCEEEIL